MNLYLFLWRLIKDFLEGVGGGVDFRKTFENICLTFFRWAKLNFRELSEHRTPSLEKNFAPQVVIQTCFLLFEVSILSFSFPDVGFFLYV